jgi:hypothetical protein
MEVITGIDVDRTPRLVAAHFRGPAYGPTTAWTSSPMAVLALLAARGALRLLGDAVPTATRSDR